MKRTKAMVLLVVLNVFWSFPVLGWDPTELPPGFTLADPRAPVELEGKLLFQVRLNFKSETAQKRAQIIKERILKLAQDPLFRVDTITVEDNELSSDIKVGDQVIFPVWAFEAKVEGRPKEELARDYADKIRQAIAASGGPVSVSGVLCVRSVLLRQAPGPGDTVGHKKAQYAQAGEGTRSRDLKDLRRVLPFASCAVLD